MKTYVVLVAIALVAIAWMPAEIALGVVALAPVIAALVTFGQMLDQGMIDPTDEM